MDPEPKTEDDLAPTALLGAERTPASFELTDPLLRLGSFGKYRISEQIGEGGFGRVYRGEDPLLGRTVAIKTCNTLDQRFRQRFLREAKISAGLQHPNIVTIHDFGYEGDLPFLVQEFLPGEDLTARISRPGAINLRLGLDYLQQVARGLAHAHQNGVLHRDIKPANIRILPDGRLKLMDFGIARIADQTSALTTEGVAMGTIGYLAPEQLKSEPVDARGDIFSFGVVAYELLTGRRPFAGDSISQTIYKLLHDEPAPLDQQISDCPAKLHVLVHRCLAKEAVDRYPSFAAILDDLGEITSELNSGRVATPLAPTFVLPALEAQRSKLPLLGLAAAVVLVLALAAWMVGRGDRQVPAQPAAVITTPAADTPAPVGQPTLRPPEDRALTEEKTPARPSSTPTRSAAPSPGLIEAEKKQRQAQSATARPTDSPSAQAPPEVEIVPAEVPPPVATEPEVSTARPPAADEAKQAAAPSNDVVTPLVEPTKVEPQKSAPRLISQGALEYPALALRRRREAEVVLGLWVEKDGRVSRSLVKSCSEKGLGFEEAAKAAALKTSYEPGRENGEPVAMWTELAFKFQLP